MVRSDYIELQVYDEGREEAEYQTAEPRSQALFPVPPLSLHIQSI